MKPYLSTLETSMKSLWEKPALCNYRGETITNRELAAYIVKFGMMFEAAGVKPGDKIAVCAKNTARWAVSFLASNAYRAVTVTILSDFHPDSVSHLVNHSESSVLFVDREIWDKLEKGAMPLLKLVVNVDDFALIYASDAKVKAAFEGMDKAYAEKYPQGVDKDQFSLPKDNLDELAVINYTSGTTSAPKGVMLTYGNLSSSILFGHENIPVMPDDKIVSMLPMAHIYGMVYEFLYPLAGGCTVYYLGKTPAPSLLLKAMHDVQPYLVCTVPLVMEKVYKSSLKPVLDKWYMKVMTSIPGVNIIIFNKIRSKLDTAFGGKVRSYIMGGAALNPEVEKCFKKIGLHYTVGYGMTECAPIIGYADWKDTKLYSCGKAAMNMSICIDSSDPKNIPGEVLVKGPNVFLGYYKNEEATAEVMDKDGWFHTGDMGVMDDEGFLFLKGRSKCMILGPSGQNIYPEEIEGVLNNVTYVVDSLVVEDHGTLVSLIYPDYHQAELDGLSKSELEAKLQEALPEINKQIPNYAKITKMEFMPEDFERTPKRSIKRYLYQRN